MLWESKSAVVDFLAVSPSLPTRNLSLDTSKDNSIFEFEVESVQTEDSRKSDLLTYSGYGYSLSGDSNGEKKIPVDDAGKMIINFSHALTLFQVELTFGTEFNHNGVPKECPISKLTVSGTVLEGEYVWVRESDTFEVKKKKRSRTFRNHGLSEIMDTCRKHDRKMPVRVRVHIHSTGGG